jgi:addiction module RelE/StbE family toxin
VFKKLRESLFAKRREPTPSVTTFGARASALLFTSSKAAVSAKALHDDEAVAVAKAIADLREDTFLVAWPADLEHAFRAVWQTPVNLRAHLEAERERRSEAIRKANEEGIDFSLALITGWRFVLGDQFARNIEKMDKKLQGRVLEAILRLGEDPLTVVGDTIKPLTGDMKGLWRYRIGDYRLVYSPNQEEELITLLSFEPRGDVYG